MRLTIITTALAVATSCANAQPTQDSQGRPLKVVQHDIERRKVDNPFLRDRRRMLMKRAGTVSSNLANEETLYLMDATIGTPPQSLHLHLDTGSSDLWVNVASSSLCNTRQQLCQASGTYSANDSSTYHYINSLFEIQYADGSGSEGDYASDTVAFGGISLSNQQIGIGYNSTSEEGIMGIGYAINEAVVQTNGKTYTNVPSHLVQSGLINTNAYSLWLNDLDASQGQILFGGVNSAKYSDPLVTVPIVQEYGLYQQFVIALTAVGQNGNLNSIASNQAIGVLLDSGSSLTYLPNNIATAIYNALGVTYSNSQQVAQIDCSRATSSGSLDFTFSGVTIQIDMSELVVTYGYSRGQEICIVGIVPADSSTNVLGDTFLRSAYVVYDLQNNAISLAQTKFNSTTDNIKEIPSGTSIPGATAAPNPVTSVVAQATGGHINGGFTISSGFAAPTAAVGYNAAMIGALGAGLLAVV